MNGHPAEIRFAGSGSREAQSQGSSFKPFLEQYLTFSRWSAKPRHVEGAKIALIARVAKWCHELVGGLGSINNRNRCGAEGRQTSASDWVLPAEPMSPTFALSGVAEIQESAMRETAARCHRAKL